MHRIHYIVGYEKCMVSYYVIYARYNKDWINVVQKTD